MYTWPVPKWDHTFSYHKAPRCFGARRDNGKRKHAGCDLYAPEGSPVRAMWSGKILRIKENFYGEADVIEIDHGPLGIVRYGEVIRKKTLVAGHTVHPGDVIGTIATLKLVDKDTGMPIHVHPMLHLELYSGKASGPLTCAGNAFHRRSDLVDPTKLLDSIRFAHSVKLHKLQLLHHSHDLHNVA